MNIFKRITSSCLPIPIENIDTDQIVPAKFLKITQKEGFGKYLFYNWRFEENGKPKKNKYFPDSNKKNRRILVASNNFGCGSSREHAVWAIMDYGFKVVISSSFGEIFYNNSLKNGLLPVILKPQELNKIFKILVKNPGGRITVDLENQMVRRGKENGFSFLIDEFRKTCLLNGVDELGYILSFESKIHEYEKVHIL